MKDCRFASNEFLRDRITTRQCLFGPEKLVLLPGAVKESGGASFSAPDRLEVELDCSHLDLSHLNRLTISARNGSRSPLLAGVTLLFERRAGSATDPVSFSGGRENLPPGDRAALSFPSESFGSYGSPDGLRGLRRMALSFSREKTDTDSGEIRVCLQSVFGERRLLPEGPRLTDRGLARVLRPDGDSLVNRPDGSAGNRGWKPSSAFGVRGTSTLHKLAMAIPPPHPYPCEGADDLLAGRIMGQLLPEPIRWDADPLGMQEWTHYLNRHHFLKTAARHLEKTGREDCAAFLVRALRGWIVSNPVPVGSNGGAGPSWETLTAAWRLREWLLIMDSLHSAPSFDEDSRRLVLRSIWEHARSLMHHKGHPNNWIIVEAAALALAGITFPEFIEAPEWTREGLRRLFEELERQFFGDEVHFELSPLYHAICIGACLEVLCAAKARRILLPTRFAIHLEHSAEYLASLCRPDFTWPSLNDSGAAAGDYTALLEMAGTLFTRPDMIWIGSKGRRGSPPDEIFRTFRDAGIVTMRSGYEPDARFLIFRAGPPGAAHCHGDALSLDVTAQGRPRLVDPGITAYAPGPLTDYYRSATAHNTISIDGKGPVRSRLPFAERVKPAGSLMSRGSEGPVHFATGICGGFADEPGKDCVVSRTVAFVNREYWLIRDDITGVGNREVTVGWQFFPGRVEVDGETGRVRCLDKRSVRFMLIPLPGRKALTVETATGSANPPCGWVSLKGNDLPATHVRYRLEADLPVSLIWLLLPCPKGSAPDAGASRRDEGPDVVRIEVVAPNGRKDVLTSSPPNFFRYDSGQ